MQSKPDYRCHEKQIAKEDYEYLFLASGNVGICFV